MRWVERLIGLAVAAVCVVGCGIAGPSERPNVVLVSLDTLRADHLGVYGYGSPTTPNLDALAEEGVVFLDNYTHAPNTAPSHATILTSLVSSVHGVWRHGQRFDETVPVLPQLMHDAGWSTAAFTQLNGPTYRRGFDLYERLPGNARRGTRDLDDPSSWVDQRVASGEPFFLFLHAYDVHIPYRVPPALVEPFDPGYDGDLPVLLDRKAITEINDGVRPMNEAELRQLLARYDAQLARIDRKLGAFFDHLRGLGVWDSTIVVVLADHGEEFGEHGRYAWHSHTLYQELLRTPLVLRGPGIPAGRRIDTTVRNLDVAPTILELVGIESPELFMGASLRPVWEGRDTRPRDVLAERASGGERALVVGSFKYFRDGRLFDLASDPGETVDVAERHPDVVAGMQERFDALDRLIEHRRNQVDQVEGEELTDEEIERLEALGYM